MNELKLLSILVKCIDLNFLGFVCMELLILLISYKLKENEDVILSSIAQVLEDTFSLGCVVYIGYKVLGLLVDIINIFFGGFIC